MLIRTRSRAAARSRRPSPTRLLALAAVLLLGGLPARATPTTFFGQDVPPGGAIPSSFPNSDAAKASFLTMLGDPGTEDFSAFHSGNDGPLDLLFRNPAGSGAVVETGTLTDPSSGQDGFIATAQIAKTGFPISGRTYWKNTTEQDEGLFRVRFDDPVRAFGFYATAYSTLNQIGGTQLVLDLDLVGGGTTSLVIPPDIIDKTTGKVFFFGVVTDPFLAATLRNAGPEDGDVIGFDDFTVAHVVVPEPATGWLLAGGVLALGVAVRRRRSA
jgi:PEP-CTERM motif-containing protein